MERRLHGAVIKTFGFRGPAWGGSVISTNEEEK